MTTLITYDIFKEFNDLFAFTTTKATLNIDCVRFTNKSENKAKLAEKLKLNSGQLIFPKQTHTATIYKVKEIPSAEINDTDALISNCENICLCIQTADCVPVLIFDPQKKVISAIHAGWRGTVAGIVEKTVRQMIADYGSLPQNIRAAIGPSISPNIYEVGNEVINSARKIVPNAEKTLFLNENGKFHFNLWEANRQFLLKDGLLPENIQVLGQCSYQQKERYYSARRDGVSTGRMVSGIMIKSAKQSNSYILYQ